MLSPYPSLNKTAEQEYVNRRMTKARISVENAFGATANLWRTNQLAVQLQAGNSPVAAFYMTSIMLTNLYTCMKHERSPFGLRPPTLEAYIAGANLPTPQPELSPGSRELSPRSPPASAAVSPEEELELELELARNDALAREESPERFLD